MPAVPKRKTSKGRRDRRRSHHVLTLPAWVICPKCKEPMLPYHACPNCGAYRGRQAFTVKEKGKK